ncbi:MAG: recombination regulator RecX [Clostridium sp.]|nr:recombination regulator RecX [Clostridium sp.]MCM1548021.1 recombination regulator RecX [Ruminococcus sp.]
MRINSIKQYKGDTFCVIIDGNKKIYLNRDIIARFGLNEDDEIEHEALTEILYASDLRRAKRRAMYLINEHDYSYIQLFEKLQKNYPDRICYEVSDFMAKNGYINDRRFAEQIVYNYMICKCYGPRRVRQELYKRGIRGSVADEAIEAGTDGLYDRLMSVIERKYAAYLDDPEDKKSVAKVKNGLARMGYDFDDINEAVNDYFEDE